MLGSQLMPGGRAEVRDCKVHEKCQQLWTADRGEAVSEGVLEDIRGGPNLRTTLALGRSEALRF